MNQELRRKARLTSFLNKALKPLFAVCAVATVLGFHNASAGDLFWDANGGTGGTGFWNTTTNANWGTAEGQTVGLTTWPAAAGQTNTANFTSTGTGGTVTINDDANTIFVSGITFGTTGYNITDDGTGGTLQLDNGSAATAVTISVGTGLTATITTALNSGFTGDTLLINGGGKLIIAGFNSGTYVGTSITIDGGTTVQAAVNPGQMTGNFAIPSGVPITIGDAGGAGTLDLNGTSQTIFSLTGNATGVVTNTNTGAYSTLTVGTNNNGGTTTFAGKITDTATSTETSNNATPIGGLGLIVNGPTNNSGYTLILSGTTNNYHGKTVVGNGLFAATLQAGNALSFSANSAVNVTAAGVLDIHGFNQTIAALDGTGTGTVTNNAVSTPATLTLNGDGGTDTLTSKASIVDGGTSTIALTKTGNYVQILAGNSTYSGATTVTTGTLANGSTTGFSPNSAYTVNGTLDLNGFNASLGSLSGTGNLTNGAAGVTGPTTGNATVTIGSLNTSETDFTGNISDGLSGTLALTKTGTGTLVLGGTDSYTGATTVNNGTLAMSATSAFATSSNYTINAPGILDVNGFSGTVASLSGNGTVVNGSGNVAAPGSGNAILTTSSGTFAGALNDGMSGTLGLTKIGAGTLTLSGASSTYSGGTILQSGTLIVANSGVTTGPLGKGNVTVNGGFLQSGGTNTNIQVGANYTQAAGGELDLRIGGTAVGTFDRLTVVGSATLSGKLTVNSANGYAPKIGDMIPVVTTGKGVTGQFASVTGNLFAFPMVKLNVNYTTNQVILDFEQASFSSIPMPGTSVASLSAAPGRRRSGSSNSRQTRRRWPLRWTRCPGTVDPWNCSKCWTRFL